MYEPIRLRLSKDERVILKGIEAATDRFVDAIKKSRGLTGKYLLNLETGELFQNENVDKPAD
jgi:hypothetical protein